MLIRNVIEWAEWSVENNGGLISGMWSDASDLFKRRNSTFLIKFYRDWKFVSMNGFPYGLQRSKSTNIMKII